MVAEATEPLAFISAPVFTPYDADAPADPVTALADADRLPLLALPCPNDPLAGGVLAEWLEDNQVMTVWQTPQSGH